MSVLDQLANGSAKREEPKVETSSSVSVLAYNANSDPHAERFLPWLWNRLRDDGLVSLYFPGAEQTGFAAFVKLFSSETSVLIVYKRGEDGEFKDVIGFATLELMPFGAGPHLTMAAHAGFIFLKEFWDHHTSTEAAKQITDTWFGWEAPKLDVVIGIIADKNVAARRFLQRIKWSHSGNIPYVHQYRGEKSDASIWFITREMYEGGK